jgi:hypothetical protein
MIININKMKQNSKENFRRLKSFCFIMKCFQNELMRNLFQDDE